MAVVQPTLPRFRTLPGAVLIQGSERTQSFPGWSAKHEFYRCSSWGKRLAQSMRRKSIEQRLLRLIQLTHAGFANQSRAV